jgi:hypothetical protein
MARSSRCRDPLELTVRPRPASRSLGRPPSRVRADLSPGRVATQSSHQTRPQDSPSRPGGMPLNSGPPPLPTMRPPNVDLSFAEYWRRSPDPVCIAANHDSGRTYRGTMADAGREPLLRQTKPGNISPHARRLSPSGSGSIRYRGTDRFPQLRTKAGRRDEGFGLH